ncbi:MAG TPA: hypothetical protein VFC78_15570 [Tepidisphaeraceae bacterium]|nr:hypothetical protein [Tepidisphaeraceae bacterium]
MRSWRYGVDAILSFPALFPECREVSEIAIVGVALPQERKDFSPAVPPGHCRERGISFFGRAALIVALFAVQTILIGWEAYADSPTWDEIGHFAAGLDHWRHGRFDMYRVNPPLVRLVAEIPAALMHRELDPGAYPTLRDPLSRPEFGIGSAIAGTAGPRYFFIMAVARWMCIPFSLLGGWICYRWAFELWGGCSSILALVLCTFSPSVLAYGHLITPDMGAAGVGVAAAYLFRRWLSRPCIGRAVSAGVVLGLAELTKSTWIVLFAVWPALWIVQRLMRDPKLPGWQTEFFQLAGTLAIGLWMLNMGYGFEGSMTPLRDYQFVSHSLTDQPSQDSGGGPRAANRFAGSWVGHIPVPLPRNYVAGIDFVKMEYERKYWSYLNGEWRFGGWWYYYLYAMLVKEPLGTWALAVIATGAALICGQVYARSFGEELQLLLPLAVVLTLVSSQTGFNHHLRYVLPIYPFAFILISRVGRSFEARHRAVAIVVSIAVICSIVSSAVAIPHSMGYFNKLAGGSRNGHYHLGNSNVDWGQDLRYLKKWYDNHPDARPFYVSYDLPLINPRMIGISYQIPGVGPSSRHRDDIPLDKLGPTPGWYAISVNRLHEPDRDVEYFKYLNPIDMVGYSMNIYHVTPDDVKRLQARWAAEEEANRANAHAVAR